VSLKFDSKTPLEPGKSLLNDGKEVGTVTRSGFSPALDSAIGMGYVRREKSATGSTLTCNDVIAEVIATPIK
jgi:glycine cleavage system aminomethyltransferase T